MVNENDVQRSLTPLVSVTQTNAMSLLWIS